MAKEVKLAELLLLRQSRGFSCSGRMNGGVGPEDTEEPLHPCCLEEVCVTPPLWPGPCGVAATEMG